MRTEYRSPGVSTGLVGSDALKPGKESNGRDGKQSERREVSRQLVLPAAFLCAGDGDCTGTAALLVHGLLSLSLQHRASWARKVDAALRVAGKDGLPLPLRSWCIHPAAEESPRNGFNVVSAC